MGRNVLIMIALLFLLSGNKNIKTGERMFFKTSFHPDKANRVNKLFFNFNDSIPDDTLKLYFSSDNLPVVFSRDISTAVCFDSLCRFVNLTLYWEVFGKYIGYSIRDGDELTKKEHTLFSQSDYIRLNEILNDSLSALKFYSLDKIISAKNAVGKVDGISGATIPNLEPWIVPEAAFTSFTLWHITYGATHDSIVAYTKKNLLFSDLLICALQNNDPFNQIKALEWISATHLSWDQFIEPALNILHSENYNASKQALKFLKKCNLSEEVLQKQMIPLFENDDLRFKNMVIDYVNSSKQLSISAAKEMINLLKSDNYYMVNTVLTLFAKKYHPDYEDQLHLCTLLRSKNINVANRAYNYLFNFSNQSPFIVRQLTHYRRLNLP